MAASDGFNGLSRRSLLAGAAAMTSGTVLAQGATAPRAKGPIVWLDMDQKELDDAYDQAIYAPNRDIVLKRSVRNSELVRERIGAPKRFAYGPTAIEGVDVFTARRRTHR
jgi:arylformamidase